MLAEKLIPFSFSALKQMKRRKELSSFISEIRSRYFFKVQIITKCNFHIISLTPTLYYYSSGANFVGECIAYKT